MHATWDAWGRQLAEAYRHLVWQHRLPAMSAAIRVAPLARHWGQWQPEAAGQRVGVHLYAGWIYTDEQPCRP